MDPLTIGALALGGGSLLGGLFGKNKQVPQQTGAQGLAAAHPSVQHAYLSDQGFLPGAWDIFANPYQGTPMGQAPRGPFDSQALQQLQDYSNQVGGIFAGGTGVNPLGAVEPFNQIQQNALTAFGSGPLNMAQTQGMYMNPYQQAVLNQLASGGFGMQQALPGYMNPYLQQVLAPLEQQINQEAANSASNLRGNASKFGNLGGLTSSAFGQQMSELEKNRQNLLNQTRGTALGNAYNQALGQYNLGLSGLFQGGGQAYEAANQLRRQTLQDMLNAGTAIQQQGQTQANAILPQLQQTTPQAQLSQFGQNLGMIPGSQTSTGYTAQPNAWSQIGGASLAGLGLLGGAQGLSGLFGGNQSLQTLGGGGNIGTYGQNPMQRAGYSLF